MRIFLTGANGFIGQNILNCLLQHGHDVAVLVRDGRRGFETLSVAQTPTVISGDLESSSSYETKLIEFEPQAVIHAAWSGVANKQHQSIEQLNNLNTSLALLHAAGKAGVLHWIALGSQAEYGPHEQVITEASATLPTTSYGSVKLATALTSRELAKRYGMRFVWVRLFSCYGPGDPGDWFIPFIIKSLHRGESPAMTKGEQYWDYLHVRDVASAIRLLAESLVAEGVFNLASAQPQQIKEVAQHLQSLIAPSLPLKLGAVPYKKDQIMQMRASINKLRSATGWSPKISLEDGLAETQRWYREHCF